MSSQKMQANEITDREREIIALIAEGLTNNEIADRLYLSKNTIKWYVQQLNQKLYTSGREEIVEQAMQLGLLDADDSMYSIPRTNVPRQTTPFVGRDQELDELQAILDDPNTRLLTILAPGGMGKTRIALELLERQQYRFADGSFFVPLQSLTQGSEILFQIATSIGFQSATDHRSDAVLNYLADRQMLLLLDNFEQLLSGVEILNTILSRAPEVRLIVTSREKLNLLAETAYTLRGMRSPQAHAEDDFMGYDAPQLLVMALQRVRPEWSMTPANRSAVERICSLTQGMPLAILLAASWLDVYTLDRIADEIQQSVDILATTMHDVPPRQRSIRAVFDHSWLRLSDDERSALMKFSIFRNGWWLDAAEHIVGASPIVLQGLITRALINRQADGRYQLHELLRQYAEEQLIISGQHDAIHTAHITYYLTSLQRYAPHLKDRRQLDALTSLEPDVENLRAAWDGAVEAADVVLLDRALEGLRMLALLTGRMDRYSTWLVAALEQLSGRSDMRLVNKLKVYWADALAEMSQIEQAADVIQAVEGELDAADDHTRALAYGVLSRTSYILGQPEASLDYAHLYRELAQVLDEPWHQAQVHYAISLISGLWDAQEPIAQIDRCIEAAARAGDRYWLGQGYVLSGLMRARVGQLSIAQEHTEQAYEKGREMNNLVTMAAASGNLSGLIREQGEWEQSAQYLQQARQLARVLGYSNNYVALIIKQADLHLIQGDVAAAKEALATAHDLLGTIEYPAVPARYYSGLSAVVEFEGDFQEAQRLAERANDYIQTNMNWSIVHSVHVRLAWAHICNDAIASARPYLLHVTQQEVKSRYPWGMLVNVALLSLLVASDGQLTRAADMLAMVDNHSIQSGWLQGHPRLAQLRQTLHAELGSEALAASDHPAPDLAQILNDWLADNA